jgi:hypothetical protein
LDFGIADGRKRMYLPWDVDASNFQPNTTIYGSSTGYQQLIFGNAVLKERYRRIMCALLAGPLSEDNLLAFIDRIEPVLVQAVANDPYNQLGTNTIEGVAAEFDDIRQKLINRVANVRTQAQCPTCADANINGFGSVDLMDFALFANDWLESGSSLAGDIDSDGSTDAGDLEIMLQFWLSLCQ